MTHIINARMKHGGIMEAAQEAEFTLMKGTSKASHENFSSRKARAMAGWVTTMAGIGVAGAGTTAAAGTSVAIAAVAAAPVTTVVSGAAVATAVTAGGVKLVMDYKHEKRSGLEPIHRVCGW